MSGCALVSRMGPFTDPMAITVPADIASCVHCRTVTWGGTPACGCEFGRRATDESSVADMVIGRERRPGESTGRAVMISTEIGQTTPERITVRGLDLAADLIGQVDFVDMVLLVTLGRTCRDGEKAMLNSILVAVTDHGLTPSALAARLTYTGAPEAPQAAVAAGLLGAGSVFLGAMQDAADMLRTAAAPLPEDAGRADIEARAQEFVVERRHSGQQLFGYGHNIHVDGDPRVPALAAVSREHGYHGRYWELLLAIGAATETVYSRRLPVNTGGAVAAMVLSMGFPLGIGRGLALVGRCAGLLGHLIEEEQHPIGKPLWDLVLRQDPRNVTPNRERRT